MNNQKNNQKVLAGHLRRAQPNNAHSNLGKSENLIGIGGSENLGSDPRSYTSNTIIGSDNSVR